MDEKIEIDLDLLFKAEKRVWVKATSKRKGHYRKVKGVKGDKEKSEIIIKTTMSQEKIEGIKNLSDVGIEGGIHRSTSYIAEFKGGANAMYKVMDPVRVFGETTAYKIDGILNWGIIPETVSGDFGKGEGSCQKWIDGEGLWDVVSGYNGKITDENIGYLAKIFAFDVFVCNYDRKDENLICKDDKIYGIDNELWGYSGAGESLMRQLDGACDGVEQKELGMFNAIDVEFGSDAKIFSDFRDLVMNNLKEIINNKNSILKLYKLNPDPTKMDEINKSINYIEKRIANYQSGE